jgi:hypothetical protein
MDMMSSCSNGMMMIQGIKVMMIEVVGIRALGHDPSTTPKVMRGWGCFTGSRIGKGPNLWLVEVIPT